jgi:uncharacterized LabA/DUF88 family protein
MKKITFLVDGFNVYHSLESVYRNEGACYKWLDLYSLCQSFIYLFGKNAILDDVYYFTSIAYYTQNKDKIKRHKDYIRCLESKGINVVEGRFKNKQQYCPNCRTIFKAHVEKQTDIAIASKLLELLFFRNEVQCESFCIITGDTDIVPAIKAAIKIQPTLDIRFAFPVGRTSKELKQIAPLSFNLKSGHYKANQLRNPYKLSDGSFVRKPLTW